jgi:CO dehydrogenase maturation factor
VLDIEASLEHFCQNKAIHADTMLIVVEPTFKSLETARRMIALARQLEPERLALVANKVSDAPGRAALQQLAGADDVEVLAEVPHDVTMLEADLAVTALLDYDPQAPSIVAIDRLAERLLAAA